MTAKETEWARRQRRERARAEHVAANGPECELCHALPGEKGLCGSTLKRALDEDHNHVTGKHRGWICARANRQLWGWVTPEWLRWAADYLEARA